MSLSSPKPTGYFEHKWTDAKGFSNCVGGALPGALTKYHDGWHTPVQGTIFWAGSDSTGPATKSGTTWSGYMDGGVRSGQRVAAEVTAALAAGR